MSEVIFDCPYGAFMTPFLVCGNFLFERFTPGDVLVHASPSRSIFVLDVHAADGDELASFSECAHWVENMSDRAFFHPNRALDRDFCDGFMNALLEDLADTESELAEASDFSRSICDRDGRAQIVKEFLSELTFPSRPSLSTGCELDTNWRVTFSPGDIDEIIEDLKTWSLFAPLHLLTSKSGEINLSYEIPRILMQGREQLIVSRLREEETPISKLLLRELRRIADMSDIYERIYRRNPKIRGDRKLAAKNLRWYQNLSLNDE
jgi:hypothetical protein